MDRDRAGKLIGQVFNQAVDDIETERLISMKREVEARMRTARAKGLYGKLADALDTEIEARSRAEKEGRAAVPGHRQEL